MQPVKRFCGILLLSASAIGALGGALACGPSFQAIYEGNARFEHCYALEENAQTGMREKAECWRDWSEHYTYGQTRDRIHYATARYVALSQSSNVPTDEAMMMAAPGMTPRQSTITAPAPTNAFAPPPKVLDEYADGGTMKPLRPSEVPTIVRQGATGIDAGAPAPEASALPASACSEACAKKFGECNATCSSSDAGAAPPKAGGGAARKDASCAPCEKTYRGCMRGCFK